MKKLGLLAALTGLLANVAVALPMARADFGTTAVDYDFGGLASGTTVAGDGFLTVTGGTVQTVARGSLVSPTYYDGDNGLVIRMDFASAVSGVGLDFNSNNADTTLSVFDALNNLIETLTIPVAAQYPCDGFRCGFVGIDVGYAGIAYATIDTPLNGYELFVDNVVYQDVPEPATIALFGLGLLGAGALRRKA